MVGTFPIAETSKNTVLASTQLNYLAGVQKSCAIINLPLHGLRREEFEEPWAVSTNLDTDLA